MQASVKLCADFSPRDRLDLAGVDLPDSTLDLFSPSGFNPFVGLAGQGLEEAARELGPVGLRQLRCLTQELCYVT
jgi:hypothetical protein